MDGYSIGVVVVSSVVLFALLAMVVSKIASVYHMKKDVEANPSVALAKDDIVLNIVQDDEIVASVICNDIKTLAEKKIATTVIAADSTAGAAASSAASNVVLADNSVVFAANSGDKQTFDERLAALPKAEIKLYNELVSYITGKDDTKENKSTSKTQFKYSKERMMTASVKRGVMVLEFMLYNSELERNARLNDDLKSAKIAPVVIKLRTESDLAAAKQTVDMTMAYIAQERDYRKEQQKALRREKAAAAKQAK